MPAVAHPSRFGDLDEVRRRYDPATVDMITRSVFESDTAADRLVERFAELPGGAGWRMLDVALRDGIDAVTEPPAELAAFVQDAITPPDWVDLELVDRGAVAWWRAGGPLQLLALTAGSLAYGYSTSFARPLLITGRLKERAGRRLGETANWVLLATRPGQLHPGAEGLRETVRIRLVHALIRRHLRRSGEWDTANWGEPISVGDTLATGIIGFCAYPITGLQRLGVEYSAEELEAMVHLWSWISHLQGVPHEYLPKTWDEAVALWHTAQEVEEVRIEGADELVHALLFHGLGIDAVFPRPLGGPLSRAAGYGMAAVARDWMGDERADILHVPHSRLAAGIPVLRALIRLRERLRRAGLAPSDERLVRFELFAANHVMALMRSKPPMTPGATAEKPALAT